jgi:hypothetical protein
MGMFQFVTGLFGFNSLPKANINVATRKNNRNARANNVKININTRKNMNNVKIPIVENKNNGLINVKVNVPKNNALKLNIPKFNNRNVHNNGMNNRMNNTMKNQLNNRKIQYNNRRN